MKISSRLAAVVAACACCGVAWAAAPTPAQEALLRDFQASAQQHEADAVVVLKDGQTWLDYRREGVAAGPIQMMSATKSLVALGIGRLLTQGRLRSLDQPVADFYPEWRQGRKATITLRMLMAQTSGLQDLPQTGTEVYPAPDAIQLALAAELVRDPGRAWLYSNKATNLLAGVIERAAHERMDAYLERELLAPLGIRGPAWAGARDGGFDATGHPYAMAGWVASASDAARVGQLVLDEGRLGNAQWIDAAFIREMLSQGPPDASAYGLLWWRRSTSVVLDVAYLERLAAAGVRADLLDRLQPLRGRRYATLGALRDDLRAAYGGDLKPLGDSAKERQMSLEPLIGTGPVEAYTAEGYLGQFIVVVPSARLVAVRQIAERDVPGGQPWPYNDDDFTRRTIELARALLAP